jgi:hypothetical protein
MAEREHGRFRSYLLGAVKHFLSHQREAAQADEAWRRCRCRLRWMTMKRSKWRMPDAAKSLPMRLSTANGRSRC